MVRSKVGGRAAQARTVHTAPLTLPEAVRVWEQERGREHPAQAHQVAATVQPPLYIPLWRLRMRIAVALGTAG